MRPAWKHYIPFVLLGTLSIAGAGAWAVGMVRDVVTDPAFTFGIPLVVLGLALLAAIGVSILYFSSPSRPVVEISDLQAIPHNRLFSAGLAAASCMGLAMAAGIYVMSVYEQGSSTRDTIQMVVGIALGVLLAVSSAAGSAWLSYVDDSLSIGPDGLSWGRRRSRRVVRVELLKNAECQVHMNAVLTIAPAHHQPGSAEALKRGPISIPLLRYASNTNSVLHYLTPYLIDNGARVSHSNERPTRST